MKPIMKNSGFSARLFLFFLVFVFCLLSGLLVGLELFGESMTLPLTTYKWHQLVQSAFAFLLPPLLFASLCHEQPLRYLGLYEPVGWRQALLVVAAMLVAVPCIHLLAWLNEQVPFPSFMSGLETRLRLLEDQVQTQTDFLLRAPTFGGLWLNLLVVALMPALGEELFFRGALQRLFIEAMPKAWPVWLAAFVFSAVHMQFFGFVPRMLLGAFFGYLLLWSGSLWLPVLAHLVNNAIVVVFRYLQMHYPTIPDMDALGTADTWWAGVLSAVAFAALVVCLRRSFAKKPGI